MIVDIFSAHVLYAMLQSATRTGKSYFIKTKFAMTPLSIGGVANATMHLHNKLKFVRQILGKRAVHRYRAVILEHVSTRSNKQVSLSAGFVRLRSSVLV